MRYHKSYLSYFQTCKKPLPATPRLFFSRFQVCHASLAARSHLQPLAATCSLSQPHEWPQVALQASGRKWRLQKIPSEWLQVAPPDQCKGVDASLLSTTSISSPKASLYVPSEHVSSHGIPKMSSGGNPSSGNVSSQCVVNR